MLPVTASAIVRPDKAEDGIGAILP
jgi:hypothetical protein